MLRPASPGSPTPLITLADVRKLSEVTHTLSCLTVRDSLRKMEEIACALKQLRGELPRRDVLSLRWSLGALQAVEARQGGATGWQTTKGCRWTPVGNRRQLGMSTGPLPVGRANSLPARSVTCAQVRLRSSFCA